MTSIQGKDQNSCFACTYPVVPPPCGEDTVLSLVQDRGSMYVKNK